MSRKFAMSPEEVLSVEQALGILLRGGDPTIVGRPWAPLLLRLQRHRRQRKGTTLTPVRCKEKRCTFVASSTTELWTHSATAHGSSRSAQRYSTTG